MRRLSFFLIPLFLPLTFLSSCGQDPADSGVFEGELYLAGDSDVEVRSARLTYEYDHESRETVLQLAISDPRDDFSTEVLALTEGALKFVVRSAAESESSAILRFDGTYASQSIWGAIESFDSESLGSWGLLYVDRVPRDSQADGASRLERLTACFVESQQSGVRRSAIRAMADLHTEVTPVLRVALQDQDEGVRAAAVETLSRSKQATIERKIDLLSSAFDDPSDRIRLLAESATADLGPMAAAALNRVIRDRGQSLAVRSGALRVLVRVTESHERHSLLAALLDDPDMALRLQAASALSEWEDSVDIERIGSVLVTAINDGPQQYRTRALELLQQNKAPYLAWLSKILSDSTNPASTRIGALRTMARAAPSSAVQAFIVSVDSSSDRSREASLLHVIEDKGLVVRILQELLQDEERRPRAFDILENLTQLGAKRAPDDWIVSVLVEADPRVSEACADALSKLEGTILLVLLRPLGGGGEQSRELADRIRETSRSTTPVLSSTMSLLDDASGNSDPRVREASRYARSSIRTRAAAVLLEAFEEVRQPTTTYPYVRTAILAALRGMKRQVTEALLQQIEDRDRRVAALDLLEEFAPEEIGRGRKRVIDLLRREGDFSEALASARKWASPMRDLTVLKRETQLALYRMVHVDTPSDESIVASSTVEVSGRVMYDHPLSVSIGGARVDLDPEGRFRHRLGGLVDGEQTVVIVVSDPNDVEARVSRRFTVDTTPPTLRITSPSTRDLPLPTPVHLSGEVEDASPVHITVNGKDAAVDGHVWRIALALPEGEQKLEIVARDKSQLESRLSWVVDVIQIDKSVFAARRTKRPLTIEGGDRESEIAVRRALDWLARHQETDGRWKAGSAQHDVGVTALAVLAFTGAGISHQSGGTNEFRSSVAKALEFLLRVQDRSGDGDERGRFGPAADGEDRWVYDHALATLAIAELLLLSEEDLGARLWRAVRSGTELCLRARNPKYAWSYGVKPGLNDSSVTGWMVQALVAARLCKPAIPEERFAAALAGACDWYDRATSVANGRTGYQMPGDPGARPPLAGNKPYRFDHSQSAMTAVAVFCRQLCGRTGLRTSRTEVPRRSVDLILSRPPRWITATGTSLSTINMYYYYYGTNAMFLVGGSRWKEWNVNLRKTLLSSQASGPTSGSGGSWSPIGPWGEIGGRAYSTALGALTLEVYYRVERKS